MVLAEWFNSLGRRTSTDDRDGSKHRGAFIAFVLAMLLLIAALIVIQANKAEASPQQCRGPVTITDSRGTYNVTLKTNRWCGGVGNSSVEFTTPKPTFQRTYGEGPIWNFSKWLPTANASGVSTAPNGDVNVQYRAQWVVAEFELCTGVPGTPARVCTHSNAGVRIWAWANGNYSLKAGVRTAPRLPMPKP